MLTIKITGISNNPVLLIDTAYTLAPSNKIKSIVMYSRKSLSLSMFVNRLGEIC